MQADRAAKRENRDDAANGPKHVRTLATDSLCVNAPAAPFKTRECGPTYVSGDLI
jgi:hypothetical protein